MRVLILTAALLAGAAGTASASVVPMPQPPPPPCEDTGVVSSGLRTQAAALCAVPPLVPLGRQAVKFLVVHEVLKRDGRYAAHHIRRYGCNRYELEGFRPKRAVCRVVYRTRRGIVRRTIRLRYDYYNPDPRVPPLSVQGAVFTSS